MSDMRHIGTCEDMAAEEIRIYVLRDLVIIEHDDPHMVLQPADREVFDRLYQEARRQAEAHRTAEEAARDGE